MRPARRPVSTSGSATTSVALPGVRAFGRPTVRSRTPLPLPQADAQLDAAARAPPRASRPLDLAGGAGRHPTASGPYAGRRPALAMGTPPHTAASDARSGAARVFVPPAPARLSGEPAKTLWAFAWTPERHTVGPGPTLSGGHQSPSRCCLTAPRIVLLSPTNQPIRVWLVPLCFKHKVRTPNKTCDRLAA
jgi:hypothetical protein